MAAEQRFEGDEHCRSPETCCRTDSVRQRCDTLAGLPFQAGELHHSGERRVRGASARRRVSDRGETSVLIRTLSHTLYALLAMTTARSLRLVQRVPNRNGFEAWRHSCWRKTHHRQRVEDSRFCKQQVLVKDQLTRVPEPCAKSATLAKLCLLRELPLRQTFWTVVPQVLILDSASVHDSPAVTVDISCSTSVHSCAVNFEDDGAHDRDMCDCCPVPLHTV